jgi:molybdenum cofactor biosynthesis protein B
VGWITVSDTRTEKTDRSAEVARRLIEAAGHRVAETRIVPDDPGRIETLILDWLARYDRDAIVLSGGTGISARDRTYEAVSGMLDQELEGFGELFRMLSYEQVGSAAMLSRAMAGVARGKPLFALPGSPGAVQLALEKLVLPQLGHLLGELRKH